MTLQEDMIVDIPENRVRFFGTQGKMLLPCPATIEALIMKIPESRLATTDLIRKHLLVLFDVEAVCPVTTQKALKAVAHDSEENVAYWRVIKKDGKLIASFLGGIESHAAQLRDEGFMLESAGKHIKVKGFHDQLVKFG